MCADENVGSITAGVHVGIGGVAAGSTFATITSAAMGGYGVPIVFGGVWGISTAVVGGIAAWKRWTGGGGGGDSVRYGNDNDDDDPDGIAATNGNVGGGGSGGGTSLIEDRDNSDDDNDCFTIKNGKRGGGERGGDIGAAVAVPQLAAVEGEPLRQGRVWFHGCAT